MLTIVQEAAEGRINLTEEDPVILSHVLTFMYTGDYNYKVVTGALQDVTMSSLYNSATPLGENESILKNELSVHALVFKYADMLGIEALKRFAASEVLHYVPFFVEEEDFAVPLRIIYEDTLSDDPYLRSRVTKLCIPKHKMLAAHCTETVRIIMEHEPRAWKIGVEMH